MKKKSLFDIAMEQKQENQNNENIVITKKNSKLSIAVEIISRIIKMIVYILVCVVLSAGATVLVNNELRIQLLDIIKIQLSL